MLTAIFITSLLLFFNPPFVMAQNTQPVITRPAIANSSQTSSSFFTTVLEKAPYVITALLILAILVVSFIFLWQVATKSFTAMGRNPLNTPNIKRSMYITFAVIILITVLALAIVFFISRSIPQESNIPSPSPTPMPTLPSLPDIDSQNLHTTTCFSVAVPFDTSHPKIHNAPQNCTLTFVINQPFKGEFTLTYQRFPEHTPLNDPSVILRQTYPDTYTPIDTSHPLYPDLLAYQSPDEITYFFSAPDTSRFILSFHHLSPGAAAYLPPQLVHTVINSITLPHTPAVNTFPPESASEGATINPQ